MKYIKTFENLNGEPKIGDYVICKEDFSIFVDVDDDVDFLYFLNNNIGQCVNIIKTQLNYNNFIIKYDNIPPKLKKYFTFDDKTGKKTIYKMTNCRRMSENEIFVFSPDKEYLETIIATNKYNL